MVKKYFPKNFEKKWQDAWEEGKVNQASDDADRS
jgi:leucyl-tRNA synthetase